MKKVLIFIFSFYLLGNISAYSRNYDVLQYDLYVDWTDILNSNKGEPDKRNWFGNIFITLTPLVNNTTEIEFDAVGLDIRDIFLNSMDMEYIISNYVISDKKLIIPVPNINIGDTIKLIICYTYTNPYNKGFSYRNSEDTFPDDWEHDIDAPSAGSLNEPQDARYWIPCNDVPDDKALWNIAVAVPYGMKAVSNGSLDSSVVTHIDYPDGSTEDVKETFYWTSKHPMPPYLMTIAAADYELNIERIQINSTDNDSLDVYYYTFPGDWNGTNKGCNAKRMLSPTEKSMQIFSDLFGNYPFEKYGYATVDYTHLGYKSLGMEHQTITTTNRYWVKTFLDSLYFTSFAHELAHHWFGNMVTCKTWNDLWFNEGGATWAEALYVERIKDSIDTKMYFNFMMARRESYLRFVNNDTTNTFFSTPIGKIENPASALFDYSILTYSKASFIFHHLRMLLGDDVLFPLYKKLFEEYKFGNISINEFADFFVKNVPNPPKNVNLKKFIEQYVIYGGHPKYTIKSIVNKTKENRYFIITLLQQVQEESDNVLYCYETYLKIDFLDEENNLIASKYVNGSYRFFSQSFVLDKEPSKIVFDTTFALLEVVENTLTNIIDDNYNDVNIFPNPTFSDNEITITSNIIIKSIVITDLQGNIISNNYMQLEENKYSLLIPKLETGTYFIAINENNIYKLIIVR